MTTIESAWGKYPGYEINLVPCTATARVWHGDLLLAESDACLRVRGDEARRPAVLPRGRRALAPLRAERPPQRSARSRAKPTTGRSPRAEHAEENLVWTYRRPSTRSAGSRATSPSTTRRCASSSRSRGPAADARRGHDEPLPGVGRRERPARASSTSRKRDPNHFVAPPTATRRATSSKAVRCSRRPSSPRRRRCRTSA